jgi:hypothetical protein
MIQSVHVRRIILPSGNHQFHLFASGYASLNTIADMMPAEMEENKWIMNPVFETPQISGLQK